MQVILQFALLALCLMAGPARAGDEATAALAERLAGISQLSGAFNQSQREAGAEGKLIHSRGRFRLLRPDYFAWVIESPDRQQIIADGRYLWHYDLDLETVTRRPLDGADMRSPLQVLAGDYEALQRDYQVTETGRGRYTLEPESASPAFRQFTLVFAGNMLSGMEIVDNLGQSLLIEFSALDSEPGLTAGDFDFELPEGVDFFDHEQ